MTGVKVYLGSGMETGLPGARSSAYLAGLQLSTAPAIRAGDELVAAARCKGADRNQGSPRDLGDQGHCESARRLVRLKRTTDRGLQWLLMDKDA